MEFKMPSVEEMKAKTADWEGKLVGKYIKDKDGYFDLSSVDPASIVEASDLPEPLRIIRPGTPVTRDFRPFRMNVVCTSEGKIKTLTMSSNDTTHQGLKNKLNQISDGDSQEDVIRALGQPSSTEEGGNETTLKWVCPGHPSSYMWVKLQSGVVASSGISE
ncbi:hypothetical protein GQ54DRAFT_310210 [Martensiomyces pterosporus]|nr:hypothetical protein GQ54DRAFT_310210 [Martensiomyces pterosporus]